MFGGTGYLLHGNMMAGVLEDRLVLRLGEGDADLAREKPHAGAFDKPRRPMRGWVVIAFAGVAGDALLDWLASARKFALTLPPK
jgi:TfoX/Sxy family transcriptional regulator of competence genes